MNCLNIRAAVLEALRQPMEDGEVTVSRINARCTYPANFTARLLDEPLPLRQLTAPARSPCRCTPHEVQRYLIAHFRPAARPHRHGGGDGVRCPRRKFSATRRPRKAARRCVCASKRQGKGTNRAIRGACDLLQRPHSGAKMLETRLRLTSEAKDLLQLCMKNLRCRCGPIRACSRGAHHCRSRGQRMRGRRAHCRGRPTAEPMKSIGNRERRERKRA